MMSGGHSIFHEDIDLCHLATRFMLEIGKQMISMLKPLILPEYASLICDATDSSIR
jgi:hypothetical protein